MLQRRHGRRPFTAALAAILALVLPGTAAQADPGGHGHGNGGPSPHGGQGGGPAAQPGAGSAAQPGAGSGGQPGAGSGGQPDAGNAYGRGNGNAPSAPAGRGNGHGRGGQSTSTTPTSPPPAPEAAAPAASPAPAAASTPASQPDSAAPSAAAPAAPAAPAAHGNGHGNGKGNGNRNGVAPGNSGGHGNGAGAGHGGQGDQSDHATWRAPADQGASSAAPAPAAPQAATPAPASAAVPTGLGNGHGRGLALGHHKPHGHRDDDIDGQSGALSVASRSPSIASGESEQELAAPEGPETLGRRGHGRGRGARPDFARFPETGGRGEGPKGEVEITPIQLPVSGTAPSLAPGPTAVAAVAPPAPPAPRQASGAVRSAPRAGARAGAVLRGSSTSGGIVASPNLVAATTTLPPGAFTPAGRRRGGATRPPRAAQRPNKGGTPAAVVLRPLVRLVTDIPTAIWAALGALAALALAFAAATAFQARRAAGLVARRRRLEADVATLSEAVLPVVPAAIGGLAISVASRSADGPASGGDFHDAFELADGRVAVVVGDVAGHGRDAVAATVLVRHTVRAYLEAGLAPRAALATAGAVLADRHEGLMATAVVALHDRRRGTLTLASAGHEPPVVLGPGSHRPVSAAVAPPLGTGAPTGRRQTVVPLPAGTAVCLFTDGVTDARVGDGRAGSEEIAAWLRELGPELTAAEVLHLLDRRAGRVDDDVTVCVLRGTEQVDAPADPVEELVVTPGDGPALIRFLVACGVGPARAAELAVRLEEDAAEGSQMVAQVRIGARESHADLRPVPAQAPAFAA